MGAGIFPQMTALTTVSEVSTVLPGERGEGKIQDWHRDRLAIVHVRQSSRQQVADHGESTPSSRTGSAPRSGRACATCHRRPGW